MGNPGRRKDSDPFARITNVLPEEPASGTKQRRPQYAFLPPIPIPRDEAPTLERPASRIQAKPAGKSPRASDDLPSVIIAPEPAPPSSRPSRPPMRPLSPALDSQVPFGRSPGLRPDLRAQALANPRRSRPPGPIGGAATERVRGRHVLHRPAIKTSTVFILLGISVLVFAIGIATLLLWGRPRPTPVNTATPSSETTGHPVQRMAARITPPARPPTTR